MAALGFVAILVSSCVCLYLLYSLFSFLHRVWWNPINFQQFMNSQGIKGPPYRFIYGNTREMIKLIDESMSRPLSSLSHDIFHRAQPHFRSWTKAYGMDFLYWMGPQPQLFISSPELIREILHNRDKIYPKPEPSFYLKKLLGDGLASCNGEKWCRKRKLANFAFHGESLKNMMPAMVASVEMMLERWRDHVGNEIEVVKEFKLLTCEVISRTAFGSSYLEGKNIFDMITKLTILAGRGAYKLRLPVISKIFKSRDEIEAEKLENEIQRSILEIIKKREEKMVGEELESYGDDFLGLLLKAYHDEEQSKRISVEDVIDECKTFYLAGQETTTMLLSWTVCLLAIHTDWQEKARNEVLKFFGHQTPSVDGIGKLRIMGMIINESLRLYPPAIAIVRKAESEVRLGMLTLPTNMNLYISVLSAHHDPCTWGEDVHLFKPERFTEGVVKATNNNAAAYLPFGLGPRTCVGFNFAITEAKIALSMILQRYSFTVSPAYVHSPVQSFIVRAEHGILVLLSAL